MIRIDGLTALELLRAGYKVKRHKRYFTVSQKSIIRYIIKGGA